ncbi:MAG: AraC family transcriptional regulator [Ruminococcus sp.]
MKIGTIGYNYSHKNDFVMDRPNGPGSYLMLLVKDPAIFEINGIRHHVQKHSFIILSPSTPCKYYADGETYTDDWIYFNLEAGDAERFARLDIPFDQMLHLGKLDELSRLVHILAYEHYSPDPHQEEIEKHYTEILLLKLSSLIRMTLHTHSPDLAEKNDHFTHLRNNIYTMPESITDVDQMAKDMGMSRSGFQHLYKKIFGVSVMQDIMRSRMAFAKQLLSATNMRIHVIAEKCGYTSAYSFMRQFKKYTGQTPSEYRTRI